MTNIDERTLHPDHSSAVAARVQLALMALPPQEAHAAWNRLSRGEITPDQVIAADIENVIRGARPLTSA